MTRLNKVGTHKTSVTIHSDLVLVKYHSTYVVSASPSKIVLNHGGYMTSTTKTRMNQASNQFGLGFKVFQKDRAWFASYNDQIIPFQGKELVLSKLN